MPSLFYLSKEDELKICHTVVVFSSKDVRNRMSQASKRKRRKRTSLLALIKKMGFNSQMPQMKLYRGYKQTQIPAVQTAH